MNKKIADIIKKGGVGIFPTDTLYEIVGSAFSRNTVERIYNLKKRDLNKPFIVLISSLVDLESFGIRIDEKTAKILEKFWPGKVSIILPCDNPKFEYLHRGTKSLAFRMPNEKELIKFLKETGPLVAPSANIQNFSPAKNIKEAKEYFGDAVDFYEDGGILDCEPSTVIKIDNGEIVILREGSVKV